MWDDDYDEENLLELDGLGQFLLEKQDDGTWELELVNAYMQENEGNYPDFVIKNLVIPREYEGIPITKLRSYDYNGEDPGGADDVLSVTVPDTVTEIYNLFQDFTSIEHITLPDSVVRLTGCTFEYCYALKSVRLSKNLKEIGRLSFCWCQRLREIELPESLELIEKYAFEYCVALEKIRIPKNVSEIGFRAFGYTTKLREIDVDEDNQSYKSIDGNLYTKDGRTLIKYAQGKPDEDFFVPEGVELIADEALNTYDAIEGGLCSLRRVILPKSLVNIEDDELEMYDVPHETENPELIEVGTLWGIKLLIKM